MAELGAVLGGRYRLDQVLGQGGMATIFRATDAKLDREVAVKVLRPEFGSDPEFVQRFTHEARAAASLNHPNVVAVYDFGTDPAGPYLVMEQVAGGDLSLALGERGVLPPTAVARTGQQVADALAAAHARGLVHRDIKPGNILLSPDGRVQVADFGIAQAAASSPVTSTGLTLGSVLYFSPEQARGDSATTASDIYSLGLVMYELLTGRRAFAGDSPAAVAVARLSGGIPAPMSVRPDTPPALDAIVRWCLAIDPDARPTAGELSTALARFIADPSGAAYASSGAVPSAAGYAGADRPANGAASTPPPPRRTAPDDAERAGTGPWGWLAAAFGLIVIVASGILLFLLFSGVGDASPNTTPSPQATATLELVRMPDFVGRMETEAVRLADRRGLQLEIEYVETGGRPGRVVDQLPDAGAELPAGTTVAIMVATRSETVVVPEIMGMREAAALDQLTAAGLRAGRRRLADDVLPEGYVVSSDPRAGVSMTRDSAVDYVVSTGRGSWAEPDASPRATARGGSGSSAPPSPSVFSIEAVGSATPSAASRASAAVSPPPPTAAPGSAAPTPAAPSASPPVAAASPSGASSPGPADGSAMPSAASASAAPSMPGSPTPTASAVPEPSSSPVGSPPSPLPSQELVLVGDFRCLDLATARDHIEKAGLIMGATIPGDPAPGDDWLVQAQLPNAGEYVSPGSDVNLVLADPMEPCPAG
jgi:serine/threonine-protein kinase